MSNTKSNKPKNRKPVAARNIADPVFTYISLCCNALAKKPPCERSREDKREHKFSQSHLGKWHCTQCSSNCKVRRERRSSNADV